MTTPGSPLSPAEPVAVAAQPQTNLREREEVREVQPRSGAREALRAELMRLWLYVGVGLVAGASFGIAAYGVGFALAAYLLQHLRQLWTLRRWVDTPKAIELPEVRGLWGDIFESLEELQKRNRKRKKKLAAILAEFQASTAALPDGAVVLGERGEIVWFNRAAQALLGLHSSQDLGLRIANLIRHPDFGAYVEEQQYDREVEVPSAINHATILALRIIPYGNNQRLLIVRDVSELRRLDAARRDFVANASHELRTPLTVLRGYLDMMEADASGAGSSLLAWQMPIREMRTQATRMEALIRDMLKLARLEADAYDGRQELLDIPRMLQRLVDELRSVATQPHRFELAIQPELMLYGRDTEAHSIFGNIIANAIRYTPEGGVIRVSWQREADGACFAVADSGIGIAEEDIPRLTERFYRVDIGCSRASGGTGLGLSIVKHALERHEGILQIDSELGVGSTFSCHFPPHRVHSGRSIASAAISRSSSAS